MAAIVGLTLHQIRELVTGCSREDEPLDLANIHPPTRPSSAIPAPAELLMERLKQIGGKPAVCWRLNPRGHCRLLAEASGLFQKDLEQAHFRAFERPVIPNCDPAVFYTPDNAAELLRRQIVSPVRWQETVEKMAEMGVETFVEVGPEAGPLRPHQEYPKRVAACLHVGNAESVGKCRDLVRDA